MFTLLLHSSFPQGSQNTHTHTLLLSLTKSPPEMNHGMSNETHHNQSTCLTTQREHREGGLLVTEMHTNWHTFMIHIIMTMSPHTLKHAHMQYHLHSHYVPFNTQLFTFISLSWSLFYFLLLSLPAHTQFVYLMAVEVSASFLCCRCWDEFPALIE